MLVMVVMLVVIVLVDVFVVVFVLFGHLMPPLDGIVRDPGRPVDSGSLPLSRGGR
jgi:hypothetical protein